VRNTKVWLRLLGLVRTVLEGVVFDEDTDAMVVSVRPRKGARQRCGRCGRRAAWYDRGEGRRRWRSLDLGELRCFLEADAPRVSCPEHGPTVIQVPWARHGAGHTLAFDDQVAWLATHTSKTAVVELMRIAWRSVGAIITRVVADARAASDPFEGLQRIGIDEVSYRRGFKFLTVVVDHDSGRLVWAAPGKERRTLEGFFDLLGEERCGRIRLVSADGAEYIAGVVAERCPNATVCADPFHVVSWATKALDEEHRQLWNDIRRQGGDKTAAITLQRCRYALWKNPENLTDRQRGKLASVAKTNARLYRAYLIKEQLRLVFHLEGAEARRLLRHWLGWAARCRIPAFVELGTKIRRHLDAIHATLDHGLSNGLVESTNTKIRLLTRTAFGFRSPEALIALALLDRGGYCPPLPGRPE
jgi:transposase